MSRDQRHRGHRGGPNSFRCKHCGLDVPMDAPGTAHRNHCPNCLWSRHLDDDTPATATPTAARPWSRSRSASAEAANGCSSTAAPVAAPSA